MDPDFEEWLRGRPAIIQEMGCQYPPGEYVIVQDAPYAITCPGTVVSILAYGEDGKVTVVVAAEDLMPAGIEHIRELCARYGKDFEELKSSNHSARVEPKYLIPHKRQTT